VGDTGPLRSSAARQAVVRPLARAAERACVRPGCPAPAQASLTFRYASREAWIERLTPEPTPEAYDLCSSHASRTQPPHGWQLRDRRPREEQLPEPEAPPRRDLGGEDTVAVLAAALRAVPEADDEAASPAPASSDPLAASPADPEEAAAFVPPDDPEAATSAEAASSAVDAEATPEETTSPVLEQPRVPRLFTDEVDPVQTLTTLAFGEDEADEEVEDDAPGLADDRTRDEPERDEPDALPSAATPRPVPAARARGIAPPANRSVQAPHGTALDW
jgi:hypothetical protein